MYRHPSKRKQLVQRIVVYSVMSVAVVALVVVLLFVVQGYRLNREDGRIEQGSLMQFDSKPNGADVSIDGIPLGSKTASKATVSSGSHFVTMNKDGYRQWQKSVNIAPGAVLWLNYSRLIPVDVPVEKVADFPQVDGSLTSPDNKWMAVKENHVNATISLFDISREEVKVNPIEIPATEYTSPSAGKGQNFSLETWDPTSRYLLVRHTYNDGAFEWLVVDTENPSQTKNITRLLGVTMSKVVFSGNNNILYVQTDNDVRKVDIGAATLSRPLVGNVAEFAVHDRSTLVFTTLNDPQANNTRSIGYYEDGAEKPHILRSYSDDGKTPLHVAFDKYFGDIYITVAYGESVDVVTGRLPANEEEMAKMTRVTLFNQSTGVDFLEMRTNGRFVIAQKGNDVQVYDLELKNLKKTTLKGPATTKKANWLDGYNLWSNLDGTLRLYEFDGANQQDIMPALTGQMVSLSPDGTFLYSIAHGENNKIYMTRARLIKA